MTARNIARWWGNDGPGARSLAGDPVASLHREMDRLFGEYFGGRGLSPFEDDAGDGHIVPSVDVSETDTEVQVTADMPGMDEKDIEIELHEGTLLIKGERKAEKEEKKKEYHRVERTYGLYQRRVPLPCAVDDGKAKASFSNGVLSVQLPKAPEAQEKIKKIKIKAA